MQITATLNRPYQPIKQQLFINDISTNYTHVSTVGTKNSITIKQSPTSTRGYDYAQQPLKLAPSLSHSSLMLKIRLLTGKFSLSIYTLFVTYAIT